MRMIVRSTPALFGFAWTICATSCVDTSPLFISKDGGVVLTDVVVTDDVTRINPACHACIIAPSDPGPGCGNQMEACIATPYCSSIYECAYANGCVFKKTQGESIGCAFPCANDLTNAYDSAITAALSLTTCFHMQCHEVCALQP